jgi:hypothetical protein
MFSADPYVFRIRLLYGLPIMGHGRRQIIWFGVTAHPTEWIANQITEACGWEQIPRYLIRDRDGAYGKFSSEDSDQWAFAIGRHLRAPRTIHSLHHRGRMHRCENYKFLLFYTFLYKDFV